MHGLVHHHLHERKYGEGEGHSPSSPWIKLLDKITIAAGIIGPLMVMPQIFKIYLNHSAAGVSILSWFAFTLGDVPFLIYGIVHKDRPIVITYTLWLIANLVVVIGAIIYGS